MESLEGCERSGVGESLNISTSSLLFSCDLDSAYYWRTFAFALTLCIVFFKDIYHVGSFFVEGVGVAFSLAIIRESQVAYARGICQVPNYQNNYRLL